MAFVLVYAKEVNQVLRPRISFAPDDRLCVYEMVRVGDMVYDYPICDGVATYVNSIRE